MQKITALRVQKKNNNRVNVYLDSAFAFGLSRIVAAWLEVGQEITEEKIKQLIADDAEEVAFQRAIKFISYRPRATNEVRKYLEKHDTPIDSIEHSIQRLIKNGLLDDARFANLWVENRTAFRPRGRRALEFELRQHGIDTTIIQQSLASIDEEELAIKAAEKKFHKYQSQNFQKFREKMYRYLVQRGFCYEAINIAIGHVWNNMAFTASPYEEEEVDT
jgi:regulatory protein